MTASTALAPSRHSSHYRDEVTHGAPLHFFDDPIPDVEQEETVATPTTTVVDVEGLRKQIVEVSEKDGQRTFYVSLEVGCLLGCESR